MWSTVGGYAQQREQGVHQGAYPASVSLEGLGSSGP